MKVSKLLKTLLVFLACLISNSVFSQWENFTLNTSFEVKPFTHKEIYNKGEVIIKAFSLFALDRQVSGKWNDNKFASHSADLTAELVDNMLIIKYNNGNSETIKLTK